MSDFAAGFGRFAVQVQEDIHVIVVERMRQIDQRIMGVLLGTAQDVHHNRARYPGLQFGRRVYDIEDGAKLCLVLRHAWHGFDCVVARVMTMAWPIISELVGSKDP